MANPLTAKVTRTLVIGGITIGGVPRSLSADQHVAVQNQVAADQTNVEIDVSVVIANVVAIAIEADKDCTVKTNSTSAPDETLSLKARQPLIWCQDDPNGLRFITHNITKLFVTTGDSATTIKFAAAVDSTP